MITPARDPRLLNSESLQQFSSTVIKIHPMSSRLVTNLKEKHLLLTFDAFGTLYKPRTSISSTYARIAKKHGIESVNEEKLAVSFKKGSACDRSLRVATKKSHSFQVSIEAVSQLWQGCM